MILTHMVDDKPNTIERGRTVVNPANRPQYDEPRSALEIIQYQGPNETGETAASVRENRTIGR